VRSAPSLRPLRRAHEAKSTDSIFEAGPADAAAVSDKLRLTCRHTTSQARISPADYRTADMDERQIKDRLLPVTAPASRVA